MADWDCPEAFDMNLLEEVLEHTHKTGETPDKYISKEETNELGPQTVPNSYVEMLQQKVSKLAAIKDRQMVFVDGIMLYHEKSHLVDKFDTRFFLRASFEELKKRRAARAGYVTQAGFWQDPPGYFEDIVWPGFVKNHSYLFENGDVDGTVTKDAMDTLQLHIPHGLSDMTDILNWAVTVLLNQVNTALE
jgi:nicotinamide/nicotinate riboside kinase